MTTIVPPSSSTAAAGTTKKPSTPGQPWSHLETTALIEAYESKWYSLNRGQLKAQQWEEVSATVAARCSAASSSAGVAPSPHLPPPKTGTQCRHKIEKLRKRYRSEKNRPFPSLWPYYDRMERMERGPLPVTVKAPTNAAVDSDGSEGRGEDNDDECSEEAGGGPQNGDGVLMVEVAREVVRFGDAMVRMEKRRMEMMREVERDWMETEVKRAEMVAQAQRGVLESIASAFVAAKKARKAEDL